MENKKAVSGGKGVCYTSPDDERLSTEKQSSSAALVIAFSPSRLIASTPWLPSSDRSGFKGDVLGGACC